MSVLNHLAQAAAIILLLELLVVVLVFLGISGGLAFGLHWVNGKTDWAFEKVNAYNSRATRYVHIGTDYAAKPFIVAGGLVGTVRGTIGGIEQRVHEIRAEQAPESVPVPLPEVSTAPAQPEPVLGVPVETPPVEPATTSPS